MSGKFCFRHSPVRDFHQVLLTHCSSSCDTMAVMGFVPIAGDVSEVNLSLKTKNKYTRIVTKQLKAVLEQDISC